MLKVQTEKVEPRLFGDSALMHCATLIIKDREIDPTMVRIEPDCPDYGVDPLQLEVQRIVRGPVQLGYLV